MAALMVEHLKVLISRAPKGPYGRAPKGDGGLISRACLRILSMAALTVEHLKVMAASRACLRMMAAMAAMAALTVEREIPHHMNSE